MELSTKPKVIEYHPGAFARLEAELAVALDGGGERVVLDLDRLERLDSAEVRELIRLLRQARALGGELALRSSKAQVLKTLSTTGLDRVFALVGESAA